MTALALIVFGLAFLVALLGVVLPMLPGLPIAAVGAVAAAWIRGFDAVGLEPLIWVGVLAVLGQLVDVAAGALGARVYGAGRAGFWGGVLGSLVGLFVFPPFGFLVGALVGAVGAELLAGREAPEALRAGVGAFVGSVGGVVAKFLFALAMAVVMVPALL